MRTRIVSHAEYAEFGVFNGRVERRAQAKTENSARFGRVDDSVVPETRRRKVRATLTFELLNYWLLDARLVYGGELIEVLSCTLPKRENHQREKE